MVSSSGEEERILRIFSTNPEIHGQQSGRVLSIPAAFHGAVSGRKHGGTRDESL